MAGVKRTTHRSTGGKKLYAVRDAGGAFTDIQSYERAHASDVKRTSKAETAATAKRARAAKAAGKPAAAKKSAAKRPAAKKSAPKRTAKKK